MITTFVERSGKAEQSLGQTEDSATAMRVRTAVRTVLSDKSGHTKAVTTVAVTERFETYRKKYKLAPVIVGQEFPSARAASLAVGAYLGAVSVALSNARRVGESKSAAVHGVVFKLKL